MGTNNTKPVWHCVIEIFRKTIEFSFGETIQKLNLLTRPWSEDNTTKILVEHLFKKIWTAILCLSCKMVWDVVLLTIKRVWNYSLLGKVTSSKFGPRMTCKRYTFLGTRLVKFLICIFKRHLGHTLRIFGPRKMTDSAICNCAHFTFFLFVTHLCLYVFDKLITH